MSLVIILPDSMKDQGNVLAEQIAVLCGADVESAQNSFDRLPLIDLKGVPTRWGTLGPHESAKVSEQLLNASSSLLTGALVITQAMLNQGEPNVATRLVLAFDMEPQSVLSWLQSGPPISSGSD